jgi:hypothetical protein
MFFRLRSLGFKRRAWSLSIIVGSLIACTATSDLRQSNFTDPPVNETPDIDAGAEDATNTEPNPDEDVTFETGVPLDEFSSCAQTGSEAQPVDLDIIVLLDRSGSMYGTNWVGATTALKKFVQDPASDGIRVGMLYFPIDFPPDGVVCNAMHYETLAVPIGPLPQQAQSIVESIDSQLPNGGSTPMYGALEGTLIAATIEQMAQPNHKVVVVFASDGDPNSCSGQQNNIPVIADMVKTAHEMSGIETYVIAISGASIMNLDQLAAAGGTTKAYDVTGNIDEFSQKMSEIRATALACEYIIPPPPANEPFELDKVVVKYVAEDGTTAEIPKSDNALDCGQMPGWYFDDPVQPKKITLCPASCEMAHLDKLGRVDVFFGCKPKLN